MDHALNMGMIPVIVGGAVRDFYLGANEIADFDFELYPSVLEKSDQFYSAFLATMTQFELKELAHQVFEVTENNISWQFAPPRIEEYDFDKVSYAHRDFTSHISWDIEFQEAIKRRDFTINAIGLSYNGSELFLIDSTGISDLLKKILVPCFKERFALDPVRFLRACRFKTKLNFSYTEDLHKTLKAMNLTELTDFYFFEEAKKSSRPFHFFEEVKMNTTLSEKFHFNFSKPLRLDELFNRKIIASFEERLLFSCFLGGVSDLQELEKVPRFSLKKVKQYIGLRVCLEDLANLDPSEIQSRFESVCHEPSFLKLVELLSHPLRSELSKEWIEPLLREFKLTWLTQFHEVKLENMSETPPELRQSYKVWSWIKTL